MGYRFSKAYRRALVLAGGLLILGAALISGCQNAPSTAANPRPVHPGGPRETPPPQVRDDSGVVVGLDTPSPGIDRAGKTEPVKTATGPAIRGTVTGTKPGGLAMTDITAAALTEMGIATGDMLVCTAGPLNLVAPLLPPELAAGDIPSRFTLEDERLALYHSVAIPANTPLGITLARKEGYKGELELRKLQRSDTRRDYSSDRAFANFREIRLGAIAPRILYRSSHPALENNRAPYAAQLAEQARPRIAVILNLSDTREGMEELASYIPWYENFIQKEGIITLAMSREYRERDFRLKLKRAMEFMADHKGPYLIHSVEGTDRTGFVAALLEALMGASYNEIIEDYMLSYVNYYKIVPGEEPYRAISRLGADMLAEINRGEYADMGRAAEDYLLGVIGLSPATVEALKDGLGGRAIRSGKSPR